MDLYTDKNLILESNCGFAEAEFVLLGVPFDSTSSYRPGSRFGPLEIRKELLELEKFDPRNSQDFFNIKLYDLGNVIVAHGNLQETNKMVEDTWRKAFEESDFIPITLGGEHSVSYPIIKLLAEKHKGLQVVQADAHMDMKDEFMGERWSHATVMRRASELGVDMAYIGARTYDSDEAKFLKPKEISKTKPTYITIDLDVLDPSAAPGVSNPEPSGMNMKDLYSEISKIKNIVGFDIVELNPLFDNSNVTAVTAAKLLFNLINDLHKT